jgi:hypothetical protein
MVERWCAALSALLRSVEGQLSTQQADMRGRLEFHSRKAESAREALEELVIRGDESKISQGRDRVRTHEQAAAQIRQTFWEDRMRKLRFRSGVAEQYVEAKALRDQLDRWARLRMVTDDLTSTLCGLVPEHMLFVDDVIMCRCRQITMAGHAEGYRFCVKCEQAEHGVPRMKRVVGT